MAMAWRVRDACATRLEIGEAPPRDLRSAQTMREILPEDLLAGFARRGGG
jgi:hypothetical protein